MSGARGDLVGGLILLGVTVVGFWSLSRNEAIRAFDFGSDPGPGLFPMLALVALGLGSMALAGSAAVRLQRERSPTRPNGVARLEGSGWAWALVFVATLVTYVLVMTFVGFLVSTVMFSVLWVLLLRYQETGRVDPRSTLFGVATAVLLAVAVYALFVLAINVPLP